LSAPQLIFNSDEATSNRPELVVTTGSTTLGDTADAQVRDGGSANTNYGNAQTMELKKSTSGFNRLDYLKFDLTSVSTIGHATLRVYGGFAGDPGTASETVAAYSVSDTSWSETGITWNNKPTAGTTALDTKTVSGASANWYEWDITSYLQSEKAAGHNIVSIQLAQTSTELSAPQLSFNTKEATSNVPQLVITSDNSTLGSTGDTYVRDGGYAGNNYGTVSALEVKKSNGGFNRLAYFKFDLSSVSTVNQGKLRLFGGFASDPGSAAESVAAYSVSDTSWSESTITWNNKPTAGTTALDTKTVSGATSQWYEWDITSYLQSEKAAGRNIVCIQIAQTTTELSAPQLVFNSREAASNVPQLVVT
jgi:hypothetical protein